MATDRIGLWMIGAWGGVSATVAVGLAALRERMAEPVGLTSTLAPFSELPLADWEQFVIGGHEIRQSSFSEAARQLHQQSRVFDASLLDQVDETLQQFDRNVRPGTLIRVGETISGLASNAAQAEVGESPARAIDRIRQDIREFRGRHELDHVIVVNLASTEPPALRDRGESLAWPEIEKTLHDATRCPLTASSLYAVAAFLSDCSYVNFTPSTGSDLPGLDELANREGQLHCGRDGKTGETLLKSVLAPMFAARNLEVMSWVGHNIFGNMDGRVLDDPSNKATKVHSKDHLLREILGYSPQTLVSIEYIQSLGDWKTAWDHIHFRGFLDTPMTLQFTWQGCDSLLAAPLVLDLTRFTELERRRGGRGVMGHLACFFKSPMGGATPEFAKQFQMLRDWAAQADQS